VGDLPPRQRGALDDVAATVDAAPHLTGAIVIGSLAGGEVDELSDVDLVVVVEDGAYEQAWQRRCDLHGDVLFCWDVTGDAAAVVGAHKWLAADVVLVECLITEADGGCRLAPPHRVLVGPDDLASRLPPRPPIERREMTGGGHPVEDAYDAFKQAVRRTWRDRA
jgi:hypothetical protein